MHSYPRSTHLFRNQESIPSLSAIKTADLSYHRLKEISGPPTFDPYGYPLRLGNQMTTYPRHDVIYPILHVNKINNSVQFSTITRNRELDGLPHISTELNFEKTAKFIEIKLHPIPYSTQINNRTFPIPFVVTSVQIPATDEPPRYQQWGKVPFHNPISGLKNISTF